MTTDSINQAVCLRFDSDVNKLSAILEEEKSRQNVTETIVAFGRGKTPLDSSAYYLNFAAEAIAYQKVQQYQNSLNGKSRLRSDLSVLASKIVRAKSEIKQALIFYEKE
jgi:hypothetical protein